MDAVDAVHYDASSLYKFIDAVIRPCAIKTHLSYAGPSREFFDFIIGLGTATKSHVAALCKDLDAALLATNASDFHLRAQELATLRYSWFDLHEYTKPAVDVHTLEYPVSLIASLTARLRTIPGFANVRFAIVHTSDVNYFQLQSNHFRKLAMQVSAIVARAPDFPDNLAIVGLPYSQAKAVFLNTLLAHEMGHFSYEKRNESNRLLPKVAAAFAKVGKASFKKPEIMQCFSLTMNWLEEVYCDLFALRLAGPAFSYAFIELFGLTRRAPSRLFSASHPALALRLREQVRMLQGSPQPWFVEMKTSPSHYTDLLDKSLSFDDSSFTYKNCVPGSIEEVALLCFFATLSEASDAVRALFGDVDQEVTTFSAQRSAVEDYLSFGVVPSRLIVGSDCIVPSTTALLNAAYGFNLTKLDSLLDRLSGVDKQCIECRSYWAERVEMWTAKALEDVVTNGYTVKVSH